MIKKTIIVVTLAFLVFVSVVNAQTDFFELVTTGSPKDVQSAIKKGTNVNYKNSVGTTALMCASANNPNPEVVKILLNAKADVNAKNEKGATVLMFAAKNNPNSDIIAILLKAGANVNVKDNSGTTALMFAAANNPNPEIFKMLLNAGADTKIKNDAGKTAFDYAQNNVSLKETDAHLQLIELSKKTITDIDGNVYRTVTIGNRVWMAENLKTTKLNNGTDISLITDNTTWEESTIPSHCWYNNDQTKFKAQYGALYNAYAVNTGKLAPIGWHVPSDKELEILSKVGYKNLLEGGKSGFNAKIIGYRSYNGEFTPHDHASLWSSKTKNGYYGLENLTLMIGTLIFSKTQFTPEVKVIGAMLGSQRIIEGLSVRCIENLDNEDFIGTWEEYNQRGVSCYESGDYMAATNYLNKSIEKNPNEPNAYYYKGLIDNDNNDKKSAISNFTKAIGFNPNYSVVYYNRGIAYEKMENYELAITDFTKAIELDPINADAYDHRGNVYNKLGMKREQKKDREKYDELKNTKK
jgi:uncharacterized protein (TIGR02145 family)